MKHIADMGFRKVVAVSGQIAGTRMSCRDFQRRRVKQQLQGCNRWLFLQIASASFLLYAPVFKNIFLFLNGYVLAKM